MLLGLAAAGGCVVGPNYHAAAVPAPAGWSSPAAAGLTATVAAPSSWWAAFNDAELDSLIQRASRSNLDLLVAQARLRQARAVREGSAADFWPSLGASASYARARQSQN